MPRTPRPPAVEALRLAVIYTLFGVLWILISDTVVAWITTDPVRLTSLQTAKGWLFVGASAAVLAFLVYRALARAARAQQALTATEAGYRELFQANPLPMWIYDPATLRFLAVNDAAVVHYGYSREAFLRMTIGDIRPLEDLPALRDWLARAGDGAVLSGLWRHCKRDGTLIEVDISSHGMEWGGRPARCVVATDVTERRRAERALRVSEERLRIGLQGINAAMNVVEVPPDATDVRSARLYIDPVVKRVLGYADHEFPNKLEEWLARVHPDDRPALDARVAVMTQWKPGLTHARYRMRHRDGSWRWIENTRSNLLHEPSVGAVVMNFRDITERKAAEVERARLESRLRQAEKMEAVGRLAGGIAHDFNNILGGILGYAEMLVETAAEGTPQRRYAQNVLTAANRASGLVEQILSYSRSQRGKRVPVELDRIVAETLDLVRGKLAAGITLETRLPAKQHYVIGDPTQLHQIVMNLCTNAVHAMGESGKLLVSVGAEEVDAERVFAHTTLRPGSYACLAVEDSGSGMDATTLARLFEPFFTTKEIGKGTGLGLSLVYGIVTDSGGAIDVASTPGRGSRFTIYLPRVDSPAIAEDETETPVVRGNGERIMVVEDEQALMALICEVLKRLGYEPAGFADSAAALAEFETRPEQFDALITDEVMPRLAGTELAAALRRHRSDLPIVLVSGYIGPIMSERAAAAGIREILKKPVQARELAASLARALGRA